MGETTFRSPCCFCAGTIAPSEIDPCRVTVETAENLWQVWFCHSACFKALLVSNDVVDLSPIHF